jgi:hypothetical protein
VMSGAAFCKAELYNSSSPFLKTPVLCCTSTPKETGINPGVLYGIDSVLPRSGVADLEDSVYTGR